MDPERITYFGQTDSRSNRIKFGIRAKDRTRHVYVIGKTGMGKSTLLENMSIQDFQNGEGMAFIDPHGKTAELLLDYIPAERIKDVVYFAPFDIENPISFNVMEDVGPDKRHLVVSGLMSAFMKLFGEESFSDRMQYILQNTILALLEYPGATMLGINRMLTDKAYRNKVVANVTDDSVKAYWVKEFASYTERFAAEATPAILNKIGQFTSNPLIRNIIGQPKSSFDFRKIMDEGKIMIINLSKGRVGEANANLLGSMLITKIYLAAMSRADIHEKELKKLPNFYLYVDEFQSFANESFANILSEARKYKLNLTIAHQYIEQMSEEVRAAVFGNVGTMITFRVGAFDAEVLEKEFAPQFTAEDLVNLGIFQMYLKLMINGASSLPFSATSLPPIPEPPISYKNEIIENSRKQFAKPKAVIEEDIRRWQNEEAKPPLPAKAPEMGAKPRPLFNDREVKGPNASPYNPPAPVTPPAPRIPSQMPVNAPRREAPIPEVKQVPKLNSEVRPVVIPQPIKRPEIQQRPEIKSEEGDDFLPLKDFVQKVTTKETPVLNENKNVPQNTVNSGKKNMSKENLTDLKSALAALLNNNAPKTADQNQIKTQPEIKKVEHQSEINHAHNAKKIEQNTSEKVHEKIAEKPQEKPHEKAHEKVHEKETDRSPREISEEELKKVLGI